MTPFSEFACRVRAILISRTYILPTLLLRLKCYIYGVSIHNPRCYGRMHVSRHPKSKIDLGSNNFFNSCSKYSSASSVYGPTKIQTLSPSASIFLGNNIGMNGTSIVAATRRIAIGNGTIIAANVIIMDSDFHQIWPPYERLNNNNHDDNQDITIGENVWICTGCIILKGVNIGDNSVVAAGSIVTGDVPANSLVAGQPARLIKDLK